MEKCRCGPQPNSRLLINYGFVDEDNSFDRLIIEVKDWLCNICLFFPPLFLAFENKVGLTHPLETTIWDLHFLMDKWIITIVIGAKYSRCIWRIIKIVSVYVGISKYRRSSISRKEDDCSEKWKAFCANLSGTKFNSLRFFKK